MDFKINLPTEDCTCDAKIFYDKYRKQVDAFIQHELEIDKASKVVIGRKALKRVGSAVFDYEETSILSDYEETSILPSVSDSGKTSLLSKKSSKRKVRLPKIKGAKHKGTKKGGSQSTSLSTITTETYLPEIKATKKWSDELSRNSSDLMQLIDGGKQEKIKLSWQEEIAELQFEKKKQAEDDFSTSSSKKTQLLYRAKQKVSKPRQKETSKMKIKKIKKAKGNISSSSSDIMKLSEEDTTKLPKTSWQEDIGEFLLKKNKAKDEYSLSDKGKQKKSKPQQKESKIKQKETSVIQLKKEKESEIKLSSSSSEITQLTDKVKQKKAGALKAKKKQKSKVEVRRTNSSEIMQTIDELRFEKKKKSEEELSSSLSEIIQPEDRGKQKVIDKLEIEKIEDAEDELSSSSSEIMKPAEESKQKVIKPREKEISELKLKEEKKEKGRISTSTEIMQSAYSGKKKEPKLSQKEIGKLAIKKEAEDELPSPREPKPQQKEISKLEFKKKKKGEDRLSSSSLEIMEQIDKFKQKRTKSLPKDIGETRIRKKKKSEVGHRSISTEIMQSVYRGKKKEPKLSQKEIGKLAIKKEAEDELPSSSSEKTQVIDEDEQKEPTLEQKEISELQLKKRVKSEDFLSILKSKSKKEGLDDEFITNMLAKAREAGQENELLFYLSKANEEGTLDSLLFNMSEEIGKGGFEEFATDLIQKGKEKKRKDLLLKLIDIFKSDEKDESYMTSLIAQSIEEDPNDELYLILSKAVKENNLNSLISNVYQAKKQGLFDDMVSVLLKKGKREQTKRLLSIVNSIAHENGKDSSVIEDLLSKAKNEGQLDELLSNLMKAKTDGTLHDLISTLISTTNESLLTSTKPEKLKPIKKDYLDEPLEDAFDEDFLAKWFAKAKTKKEEMLLIQKLSEIMKSGKHVEFNNLTIERSVDDIDELFSIIDEVISDEDSEIDIDITVGRDKKHKLLRHKHKLIKKIQKPQKRKVTIVDDNLGQSESALLLLEKKYRKMSKIKRQILFRRQYSVTLPDIDYDLIGRHKLLSVELTEPEKSDEEEHVYEQKLEKKISKHYRESFLKKIYGGRSIRPAGYPSSESSISSSASSKYYVRRRIPKKNLRTVASEKEKGEPSPRKAKKNIVKYVKKKQLFTETEFSDDSDISSFEELLGKKISRMCDISGEERTERGYLVGFRYKDDDENFDWRRKPKKGSSVYSESIYFDDWSSRVRRRAMVYFNSRKIDDLFHFLGSHLISDKPENPIDYLITLLGECICFRNGFGRAPLLFEQYHVESLYNSMDIFNEGFISLDQYYTGMETLFIKEYKQKPATNKKNMVLKETFIIDALCRQRIQLRNMLRGASVLFNNKENSSTTLGSVWSKIEHYHDE